MKTAPLIKTSLATLLAITLATRTWGEPPKMKMTEPIPPGIATPDKVETRLGTLTSFDGVPDAATAQKVYDNLDFQRATQAYLNSIQIASMNGMREGILKWAGQLHRAFVRRPHGLEDALPDPEYDIDLPTLVARSDGRAEWSSRHRPT